jgi:hypothetical protein
MAAFCGKLGARDETQTALCAKTIYFRQFFGRPSLLGLAHEA